LNVGLVASVSDRNWPNPGKFVVDIASPRTRTYLDFFAVVAAGVFMLLVVQPAYEFASDEVVMTSPALGVRSWRLHGRLHDALTGEHRSVL
jgi:hypothetical protein